MQTIDPIIQKFLHDNGITELVGDHRLMRYPTPKPKQNCNIDRVAVFGSADIDELDPLFQEVLIVGRSLARHNKVVIDGGGPGVMDAITKGAQAEGGKVIGVTFYPQDMPEFEGRYFENEVDLEVKTTSYIQRMFGLIDQADAFICFKGGTGTLSEWATAWLLSHLYYGNHKPMILYGSFWHAVMQMIQENFFIEAKESSIYKIVENPEELLVSLQEFERELFDRCGLPYSTSDISE